MPSLLVKYALTKYAEHSDKPVMEEVNVPVPVPLLVCGSARVGGFEMLQQIPLAMTGDLPPQVIDPPELALVCVIVPISVVLMQTVQKVESAP